MKNHLNKKSGFTLIEILIAVAILAVTLTAMANLVVVSMRANQANMNTLQGYYLASEGLEAMRNIRDSNWLQNYGWNMGSDVWGSDFVCSMDGQEIYLLVDKGVETWELSVISDYAVGAQMYEEEEIAGYVRFTHDSSEEESSFNRYVKVYYENCDDDIAEVSSVVFWNERGTDREVVLTTYLTDWQS